ncbi:MAG: hypothetical protein GVY32_05375 [Gammaproteobacteria bacterium]|nr:hypothetical protein [Gammaproteobacteria bacterium]
MSRLPLLACIALCLAAGPTLAQSGAPAEKDWNVAVGAAGIFGSEFPGSDNEDFMAVPFIDVEYKDRFFFNVPDGLGVNLIDEENDTGVGYRFGVAIAPEFEDRERSDAPNLPEVDMTALATAFGNLSVGSFTFGARVAHDVLGNGHDGSWAQFDLDWSSRIGRSGFFSIGPFVRFADDDYMRSFYTVAPGVSAGTGLPAFEAEGGLERIGARAIGVWRLTRQWELFGQIGVARLYGDAEDSPISVDDRSVSAIVAVAYRFR